MTTKEMIETLRYKAENIKAHIESEFFNEVADRLEKYQWIDVNDRLPEDDRDVLIYLPWQNIDVGWRYDGEWSCNYNCQDADVVAWMPLPEPYKKGEC